MNAGMYAYYIVFHSVKDPIRVTQNSVINKIFDGMLARRIIYS